MDKRINEFTMGETPVTVVGKEIKVGDKAPDFTVAKNDLTPYTLADAGNHIKLISVVPSLDTGVCELQTIRFNEEATSLGDDVTVLTISVDLPFAQARFADGKQIENALLLSDYKDLSFGNAYGFVIEELRLLNRGIVVIDRDNTVRYVEYVKNNHNHPDYDAAIEAVKALV